MASCGLYSLVYITFILPLLGYSPQRLCVSLCFWHVLVSLGRTRNFFFDNSSPQDKNEAWTLCQRDRIYLRQRRRRWVSNPGPPKWNSYEAEAITVTPWLLSLLKWPTLWRGTYLYASRDKINIWSLLSVLSIHFKVFWYYPKDTEPLYYSFTYSLVSLLSGIYPFEAMH